MPLNFLTAEPAPGPTTYAAGDLRRPPGDREHWRRPYRPGPWRVAGGALLLLLSSYVLISAVIIALAGALPGAGACVGVALLLIGVALRLLRAGVWVSGAGLRQHGVLRTVTLRWHEVAVVRTVQQPVRWLGLPRTVQGQALVLQRAPGGGQAPKVLLTDHNADFLGHPEHFDRAADVIEAWAAESRSAPGRF